MTVNITIQGNGLSYKKDISVQRAGQIITFLGTDEESTVIDPNQIPSYPSPLISPSLQSPSELINESKAKTNAQKITVIGNYLQEKDRREIFSVKEVLFYLRKIGEQPSNFSRDIGTAESLQYIYPHDVKKGE